jgi:hypothetical protein
MLWSYDSSSLWWPSVTLLSIKYYIQHAFIHRWQKCWNVGFGDRFFVWMRPILRLVLSSANSRNGSTKMISVPMSMLAWGSLWEQDLKVFVEFLREHLSVKALIRCILGEMACWHIVDSSVIAKTPLWSLKTALITALGRPFFIYSTLQCTNIHAV